ncbi:MAG: ATP-binding protein [Alphaproteobacteria bacterium]|nr:ATP-binding protein [Alphaproteobacteria bacterium]
MDGENSQTGTGRIGRIIAVSAAAVIVLLETDPPGPTRRGRTIEMGALVKLHTRLSTVFGMINALRVPLPSLATPDEDLKIIEIELLGEMLRDEAGEHGDFRRGVSAFPAIEAPVYLATDEDLAGVYAPRASQSVPIGTIYQASSVPAYVRVDDLMGKHFSVVGTTGSGKSCAVATILRAVIDSSPNAHVILLDPHNEYSRAFPDRAVVLGPDDGLRLPFWLLNFDELAEFVLGNDASDGEQRKILAEIVLAAKQAAFQRLRIEKVGSVDTPVPYRMSDALTYLDRAAGSLNRPESISAFQNVKGRLVALQNDTRFSFVFSSALSMRDDMSEILSQLFRIPVDGKPITILDISAVPSEVLNVIVSLVCRLTFDFAMWSETATPVTIVCEEAHRYAPRDKELGFEPAKRALSRIAKEGRKYGVALCVVSQRPSDLAPSLLSECNTMFALRMTNHDDQDILRDTVSEASYGLMDFLPALRNGEAIAVGEGVSMPMRIAFAELPAEFRPKSSTASFSRSWSQDVDGRGAVRETVERWRRGMRNAT